MLLLIMPVIVAGDGPSLQLKWEPSGKMGGCNAAVQIDASSYANDPSSTGESTETTKEGWRR